MALKKTHQDCHDICHQIRWFTKTVTKFGDKNPTLLITKHPSVPSSLKALTIWEISKSWPVIAKSEWKLTKNGQCWQYDQELLKIATTSSECCKQHYNDNCDEENFLVRCQIVCKCLSAGCTTGPRLLKILIAGPGRIQRQRFRSHAALELTSCSAFCSLVPQPTCCWKSDGDPVLPSTTSHFRLLPFWALKCPVGPLSRL